MATNVNFEAYVSGPNGVGGKVTGTLSLADVTVNTTPTVTGGWNTATVTADKQRSIYLNASDAATAGVPTGWYENVSTALANLFRKVGL